MNSNRHIKILNTLLDKSCPERIPLTGTKAEKNDCYIVTMDKDNEPYLYLKKFNDRTINCIKWTGKKYSEEYNIDTNQVDYNQLRITHYYKSSVIEFDSINDLRFHSITRYIYTKLYIKRKLGNIIQFIYNKKELVMPDRMDILKKNH